MSGSIYKITCKPTNKIYVGQATDVKYRHEKPYNYGPIGRWSDHISSAKRGKSNTPLAKAIREYGEDNFTVEILETDLLERLDELEAKWIDQLGTHVPTGLNVNRHSRNKHRDTTTIQDYFAGKVSSARICPIKRNGVYRIVYLKLNLTTGDTRRLTFGQDSHSSFEDALCEARTLAQTLGCPVTDECNSDLSALSSLNIIRSKLSNHPITRILITTAGGLIAVYLRTASMTSYKDQLRVCFGGKKIAIDSAYNTALQFIDRLDKAETCEIVDKVFKSRQQVATQ
jgi:group I intron endonuclease